MHIYASSMLNFGARVPFKSLLVVGQHPTRVVCESQSRYDNFSALLGRGIPDINILLWLFSSIRHSGRFPYVRLDLQSVLYPFVKVLDFFSKKSV